MKTHRCKGSLAAHASIRQCVRFNLFKYIGDSIAWRLFTPREDDEVIGCVHLDYVAIIAYCPFCGEKLSEEDIV